MSKGGGSQTTTSTQTIDPQIMGLIQGNVARSTGIADSPFQTYNGNPYAGAGTKGTAGTPATEGYYVPGMLQGYDENGNEIVGEQQWVPGTPGTPGTQGTSPNFDVNNFVSPLTANQNSAIGMAPGMFGAGQGATNAAVGGAAGLMGYQPQNITAAQSGLTNANSAQLGNAPQMQGVNANAASIDRSGISNVQGGDLLSGIQKYMNPYTQSVIDTTLADNERSRQMQRVTDNQSATASKAFGGSRQGVADSLTNQAYDRNAGLLSSQLRAHGFDTSAGLANQDASRGLQAGLANQGMDYNVAGQNAGFLQQGNQYNASNQQNANQYNTGLIGSFMGQNAANQQQANLANAGAANSMGQFNAGAYNTAQAQNQQAGLAGAGVNLSASNALGTLGNQQQSMFGNALNGLLTTGGLQQQQGQAGLDAAQAEFMRMLGYPYQGQNLINQSLGLLPSSGTTTSTGPKQDNSMGQVGSLLGGIGALAAFSDGRLKEDIVFDGYDNENRAWYQYRYIWDEHGVRRRGVIAQEILDTDPGAVSVHESGYYMVDYSKLAGH